MANFSVNIVEALPRASSWSLSLRDPPLLLPRCLSLQGSLRLGWGGEVVSWWSLTPFLRLLLWASCSLFLKLSFLFFLPPLHSVPRC